LVSLGLLVVKVVFECYLRRSRQPLDVARLQERLVVEFRVKLGLELHKFRKVQWPTTMMWKHATFVLDGMAHSTQRDNCTTVSFARVANDVVWIDAPFCKIPFWLIANGPAASPAATAGVMDE
jgi:hypothetical protein